MNAFETGLITQKAAAGHIGLAARQLVNRSPEIDRILASPEAIEHSLCGLSALAAIANTMLERICVTDFPQDGTISVGEIVYHAFRLHKTLYSEEVPVWKAITDTGDIYHQTLISVAEGLRMQTRAVHKFEDIREFQRFLEEGGGVLLSVRNTFINGETLRRQQRDPEKLDEGTHIISLMGYDRGKQTYTVFDPYGNREIMHLSEQTLNNYLTPTPRAIALAQDRGTLLLTKHILETPGIYRNEFLSRSITALVEQRRRVS